jgi:hypothetical protein
MASRDKSPIAATGARVSSPIVGADAQIVNDAGRNLLSQSGPPKAVVA